MTAPRSPESRLRRLLPTPLLSLALLVFWLLLNQSVSPGHLVLGAILGVVIPLLTESLRPQHARVRHPLIALRLAGFFLLDMARSNLSAARLILMRPSELESGFVTVPLTLRDPHGLILLAIFVNASPGTVWAQITEDRRELTLHVLDLKRADLVVQTILHHYERPLKMIFEDAESTNTRSSP